MVAWTDWEVEGEIQNRGCQDQGTIDMKVSCCALQCFLLILGIVMVAGIVNPYVFIPTIPLVVLFFYIRNYYLSTSRSIKRLEGPCKCVCVCVCVCRTNTS